MKIGILGGGQLALMMIESIKDEDIDFIVVDPNENPPASKVVKCIKSEFDDEDTLNMLSEQCDIVTIDFENVPSSSLRFLENKVTVHPNSNAVELCQDRLKEKMLFQECGIPVTNFQKIDNLEELYDISKKFSDDSILKSRFFGYDGKNQVYLKNYTFKNSDLFTVPNDHYFFLGDNRDCSKDSRFLYSVGYVHKDNLVGKAQFIFYSSDKNVGSILKFWKWNESIRINRFLKKIN